MFCITHRHGSWSAAILCIRHASNHKKILLLSTELVKLEYERKWINDIDNSDPELKFVPSFEGERKDNEHNNNGETCCDTVIKGNFSHQGNFGHNNGHNIKLIGGTFDPEVRFFCLL